MGSTTAEKPLRNGIRAGGGAGTKQLDWDHSAAEIRSQRPGAESHPPLDASNADQGNASGSLQEDKGR